MTHPSSHQPYAAGATPTPRPPPRRRVGRWVLATLGGLLMAALVLLGGLWWWAGSNTSLASALARAAQYLPEGQSLQARDVSGSLRSGGTIGWLRWSSPTLAVEVHDARIAWSVAPLLRRQLRLGEVRAAQVLITPQDAPGPQEPPTPPLQQLVLPLRIELPFHADRIDWAGSTVAQQLEGTYRYDGEQHRLAVDQVTLAQGRYALLATLQAQAPMALTATLNGTLRTPVPGSAQPLQALAQASAQGTLAGAGAQIQLTAQLRGTDGAGPTHPPLRADLQARIAPWAGQPLLQAAAEVQALDLAALWPQAPATQLSGTAALEPAEANTPGWQIQAALRNALPGPWDQQRLPVDTLQARAAFDGTTWTVSESLARVGSGSVTLQGAYTPATRALQGQAEVRTLNPAALHTLLDAAPVNGTASAESRDAAEGGAVRFSADLRAAGRPALTAAAKAGAPAPLRLDQLTVQGQWQGDQIDIARLQLDALRAQVRAQALRIDLAGPAVQGALQATLPGASAQFDGQLAPQRGNGTLALRMTDAQRAQRWLQGLPGVPAALAGWSLDGNATLAATWRGGWHDLQRQLQAAGLPAGTAVAAGAAPQRFDLQAQLSAPRLQIARAPQPGTDAGPLTLELRRTTATLQGSLSRAALDWDGELHHGPQPDEGPSARNTTLTGQRAQLRLRATAASRGAGQWQAQLESLQMQADAAGQPGPWKLRLAEPVAIQLHQSPQLVVEAGAGQAFVEGPRPGHLQLRWQPLRYAQGAQGALQLRSQGELKGLPLDWANAWRMDGDGMLERAGLAGDLLLDGTWDIDAGDTLRASASLRRSSGDLRILTLDAAPTTVVHSSGQGKGAQAAQAVPARGTPAGVRQAELTVSAEGPALRARLDWDSERAGQLHAEGSTQLARTPDGWTWPAEAPLAATVRAELPDVGVWSALAPPGWRVRGTLSADARLSGTRTAPQWSGQLAADQFAIRSLLDGVDLQDGRLRAALQGDRLTITELSLHGGQGSRARIAGYSGNRTAAPQDGGTLTGGGTVSWGAAGAGGAGIRMDLRAQARALQLLVRADRQVSVSGDLTARLQGGQFTLRGQLTTDRATIILPEAGAPTLGSDVVVRSAALDKEAAAKAARDAQQAQKAEAGGQVQAARPPDIAVTLDLGNDFALQGHGITTRLTGQLDIRSSGTAGAPPRVTGEVRTVQGRYRAWGQALDVETGLLRFNGPYDNPSLDVLAIRPNISVRAGVQVTGTAQSPRVRLYADPDLPDAEKLSWVVLGRSAASGGAEAALLQQAALALLGGGSGSGTGGIAKRVGLDEIGFKGPGTGEDASAAALTFGKRLSKDLYVTYERSLSGVLGTLYIFYDLSQHLTLRGQTGMQSAVDLIYTVRYD